MTYSNDKVGFLAKVSARLDLRGAETHIDGGLRDDNLLTLYSAQQHNEGKGRYNNEHYIQKIDVHIIILRVRGAEKGKKEVRRKARKWRQNGWF